VWWFSDFHNLRPLLLSTPTKSTQPNPLLDSSKKIFIIVTHSPYFLDFKTTADLKNIIVCRQNGMPSTIEDFDEQDEYVLSRFMSRFNTHHKQFFFSPNPVFVEGYTDQQIIESIFNKCEVNIFSSGACLIDVGGKDELAVFARVGNKLKMDARIIADFDAVFRGKLRESATSDDRFLEKITKDGIGSEGNKAIGELEQKINGLIKPISESTDDSVAFLHLRSKIDPILGNQDKKNEIFDSLLLCLIRHPEVLKSGIPNNYHSDIDFIIGRYYAILDAFKAANIYILPFGEIEHYYKHQSLDYLSYGKKDEAFHKEISHILALDKTNIEAQYTDLIQLLKKAIPAVDVDIRKHIKYTLVEWFQKIQLAIARKEIKDEESFKIDASVNYKTYSQILELIEGTLSINDTGAFSCSVKINKRILYDEPTITLRESTTAHNFTI
jgi:hypothetical protein